MDDKLRFEIASLLGMALSNLSLEQPLDSLRIRIPEIQRALLLKKKPPPLDRWTEELKKKTGPLPIPLIPGGDEAASILYYASAKAEEGSSLRLYLQYLAHFINAATYLKEP